MCGICGIFHNDLAVPIDYELLERMNSTLTHRGPDSDGFYIQGGLGMAMRRLAIIDRKGGDQPIFNEDGQIAITFNGEIYNFLDLRPELEKAGHVFKTRSDTEVIIHAYEQWGDDCLLRFNGMFAFALWDNNRRRLLLARDRMGKKPLYWHFSSDVLIWGSEAKALLCASWVDWEINPIALHHYLTLQYVPNPLTIYQDIHHLPAAHKLVIEADGQPRVERWWQLQFEPKWVITEDEACEQSQKLLKEAVSRRLISEVPLGAFLSGGIDSSIVVALMAEQSSQPVKTFSIGFEEQQFSETRYARLVAERYQTEHYEFIFQPNDLVCVIEGVVSAMDEPFADPAALPLYELARQTRQHVTVALCGDGGDETLGGYRRYALDSLLQPYTALPSWLTQRFVPFFADLLPEPGWIPEDRSPFTGMKRLANFAAISPKASLIRWGSYFTHEEKLDLYSDHWRDELRSIDTTQFVATAYDDAFANSLLDSTLSADHVTYLSGDLLPKTDRTTMAHALEARSPLLDANWVSWTARLPERFKVRGLNTKWLLKSAFKDMLPREIIQRGKQGFGVPLGLWMGSTLNTWAYEQLMHTSTMWDWFRPEAVKALWMEHESRKFNHGKRLWALLIFALWQRQIVGNRL